MKLHGKESCFLLCLITFSVLAFTTLQTNSSGKTSTDRIYIPYQPFKSSDVKTDGLVDEPGFFNFTISLDDGNVLFVWWRQNGTLLHVVMQCQVDAWLAVGWLNSTPSSTLGVSIINHANILIGSNNSVRDDTGYAGGLSTDTTNNFISSIAFYKQNNTNFEFLFPLASTDPVDQPLSVGGYGYFTFAVGINSNPDSGHDGSTGAMYIPNVYLETSKKEGYIGNSTAPFGDTMIILVSITIFSVIKKFKK